MNYDRQFWEDNARRFEEDYAVRAEGVRRIVAAMKESVADAPRHERFLLDLGCGPGVVAEMSRPLRFIGVDFSWPMLRLARGRIDELVLADLFRLPFRRACIPHAALLFVLSDYPVKLPALREVWRVLVPGGVLFFADYGRGDELWAFKRANYPRYLGREPRIYLESPGSAARLAREAGFRVAWTERMRHGVSIAPRRYLLTRTGAPPDLSPAASSLPDELSLQREFFLVKAVKPGSCPARACAPPLGALLACPSCGAALGERQAAFACTACGRLYPVVEGIVVMC